MTRILSVFLLIGSLSLCAQRDTLGRYAPGFRFWDGVYGEFQDFRSNCPAVLAEDVLDAEGQVVESLSSAPAWYVQQGDSLMSINEEKVWGFCERGQVYLRKGDKYDRLVVIGSLGHVIHREEVIDYNSGIYDQFGPIPVRREVQTEYFLDMESGEKRTFVADNLQPYIERSAVLMSQYLNQNKKQRKQSLLRYLHQFNQQFPLYVRLNRCRSVGIDY